MAGDGPGAKSSCGEGDVASNRVLIVDDNADNLRMLELLLLAEGLCDVVGTTDPTAVMTLCDEVDPDLILLDLRMPVMDGFQVMQQLGTRADFDYRPIVVLTAEGKRDARKKALALGAKDYITKPFDGWEVVLRVKNLLQTRDLTERLRASNEALEDAVAHRTANLWDALQELEKSQEELRLSREETVLRLAVAAEFRDDETIHHVRRMSRYCEVLARNVGEEGGGRTLIRLASAMHDVGKLGIPDRILVKRGKFSPEERAEMEKHAQIGHRILHGSSSKLLQLAATISLTHHERFDGSGYPRGLVGEAIPLPGRIAAIADVFDALTTNRTYRRRFPLAEALRTMRSGKGTLFDPDLLDVFLDSMHDVLRIKEEHDDPAEEEERTG